MTVSSTSNRVVYQGNGSTTAFPFAFKVNQAADLAVIYTDTTGTDFTLSPAQYSATGFGLDAGGTVTYPLTGGPIATGTTLTIYRSVAPTQPTSISNQGAMWPQVIEAALDRGVMIAQGFLDVAARALAISPTDGGTLNPLPPAAERANTYLAFDGTGQPVAAQSIGATPVSSWLSANFLLQTTATAALAALGGVGAAVNNAFTAINDFTAGRIKVPTRTAGDNGTDAASTAFVQSAVGRVKVQKFTSSGTYTPSAGIVMCTIECVGGGGGGGGIGGNGSYVMVSSGGGAGGYSRKYATAAQIGVSQVVTVGAAGVGGVSGANTGGNGGDTSVGTLCIAKGGSGGPSTNGGSGPGGIAGTGDITATGASGCAGYNMVANGFGGQGGSGPFGGGGIAPATSSTDGAAATGFGAGGASGYSLNGPNRAGGNGTAGLVIITEFCNQ